MQVVLGGVLVAIAVVIIGEEAITVLESTPDIVVGIPVLLVYYIVMEGLLGRTIGKLVTGVYAVRNPRLFAAVGFQRKKSDEFEHRAFCS
jgi:hypothetical protein